MEVDHTSGKRGQSLQGFTPFRGGDNGHRMDIEHPSSSQQSLGHSIQQGNSKVRILTKSQTSTVDRSQTYVEIGVRVSVYSHKEASFFPARVYFINPDIKISEFCAGLRNEFNIMDDPKSAKPELDYYRLFFENLRLDEEKRFAELSFVSGDHFSFCPQYFAPKESSGKMAEYLDFMLNQRQTSQTQQTERLFHMSKNDFRVWPSVRELSRMTFYELGRVENLKVENDFGRIEFLEPVDLRYRDG